MTVPGPVRRSDAASSSSPAPPCRRRGRTRRSSRSTTPCSPTRRRPSPAARGVGRRASRSSSTWPSTRRVPRAAVDRRRAVARSTPASSRGSTACTSSCGPTTTTPATASRSGGGRARRPRLGRASPTPDGAGRRRAARRPPGWIDGGPAPAARTLADGRRGPQRVGRARPARRRPAAGRARRPSWPPTSSPPSPTAPAPARIIAPAGSGKTRVLTERLRHLLVDRGYEPATVLAVAYNKQAQEEMEARTAAFRPAGPHAQRARPVGPRRAPRPLAAGARRARGAAHRRLAAARRGASGGPTPTRSRRTSRGCRRSGSACATRTRSRPRATTSPASPSCSPPYPRTRWPSAASSTSTSRSTRAIEVLLADGAVPPLDAAPLPPPPRRRVPGPHAGPRAADPPARPARRSTCSASATTTSASTATPAPTRRSSSTSTSCSRAPATHPLEVNYRCPAEVVDGAPHAARLQPPPGRQGDRPGPAADATAGRAAGRRARRRRRGRRRSSTCVAGGWPSRASSRRRSPCSPG